MTTPKNTKAPRARHRADDGQVERERMFVAAYLKTMNKAEAARAIGASEKSAKEIGYQTYHRPHVKAAIEAELAKMRERLKTTAEDALLEIARLAMFDPAHLTAVTCPADIAELPEDVRRAIVGWSWDKHGNFVIKTVKEGAVEMLGRHHGLFKDRVEHTGNVTITATPADAAL